MPEIEAECLIYQVINDIKAHSKYELRISTEDLFEAGFTGFVKATTLFDPSKGVKFSTFSYRLIHNEICNLGKQLRVKELTISSLQNKYIEDDDDKFCILDIYSSGETADGELTKEDLRQDLKRVLYAILGSRDAEILFSKFGFQGKEMTNKELSEDYNLCDERIRQVIDKGLQKVSANKTARAILSKYRLAA